jgi:hypothetical protein
VTEVAFGAGAYRRVNGRMPELRLVNMHLEASVTAENGVVLLSREGLVPDAVVGLGPVRGVHQRDGLFGGDRFTVSGSRLYRGGALLAEIAGDGPVSFASSDTEVVVTAGTIAYSYNGTDVAAIDFPDGANVRAVAFIADLFIFVRDGSGKWYWSAVLNARSVDGLDFATAESAPDGLLHVLAIGDELWLLGAATIEPWAVTGALDLPFQRFDQRIFRKGVFGTGCACDLDNAMHWVGSDGIVYRASDVPERLTDHGLEERFSRAASLSAYSYTRDGHAFFCVRTPDGTFAYDAATKEWSELSSFGKSTFRASCAVTLGGEAYLGDDATGTIWKFSGYSDPEGTFERLFTAGVRLTGGTLFVERVNLDINVGWTELLAGQGSNPLVEMRYSRDGGATWSSWDGVPMGRQGEYRVRPEWRALGLFDAPGALMEFRCTDPVALRLSAVLANEPVGGRAR